MAAKFTHNEIKNSLAAMSEASYKKYGSHSYATGVLESMMASIVANLPRHTQAEVILQLNAMTKHNQG